MFFFAFPVEKKEEFTSKSHLIRTLRTLFYGSISISWCFPLFFFFILWWKGFYGPIQPFSSGTDWCWFTEEERIWRIIYHGILVSLNILILVAFALLWQRRRELGQFKNALLWYLPTSFIVYIPMGILRFYMYTNCEGENYLAFMRLTNLTIRTEPKYLGVIASVTEPLQGIVNAIIFLIISIKVSSPRSPEEIRLLSQNLEFESMDLFGTQVYWSIDQNDEKESL